MKRLLFLVFVGVAVSAQIQDPNPFAYLDQAFVASCKDDKAVPNAATAAKNIGYASEIGCIAANLAGKNALDAKFFEYFTLSEVYNNSPDTEVKKLKNALNLAVNYTSRRTKIVNPVYIGNPAVVARIDIRDYGLNRNDFDRTLLGLYPYGVKYFDDSAFKVDEDFIAAATGSPQAWVRADWAVQQIMRPPVYQKFLRLPNSANQLFALFNVNEARDLQTAVARRSGFKHGGVSNFNRLIDYHPTDVQSGITLLAGDIWRTFDTINQVDQRNFFAFPFGPQGELADSNGKSFVFDASMFIFLLPNGLEGYFLSNAQGQSLDEAVTTIATDPGNVHPNIGSAPNVVELGAGCLHCHSGGLNKFRDEIRLASAHTAGFSKKDLDQINFLFPLQDEIATLVATHNKSVLDALSIAAPGSPDVALPESEPIFYFARRYAGDIDVATAASELGITFDDFKLCLLHSPDLAKDLGVGDPDTGKITRAAWEAGVGEAEDQCNIGTKIIFRNKTAAAPPAATTPVMPVSHQTEPTPAKTPDPNAPMRLLNSLPYTAKFTLRSFTTDEHLEILINPGEMKTWTTITVPCIWEATLGGIFHKYQLTPHTDYRLARPKGVDNIFVDPELAKK